MVLVAVGLGLAGAAGAIVFRILIRFLQSAFFGGLDGIADVLDAGLFAEPVDPLEAARAMPAWRRALTPALGGLIVGPLIYYFAREARGPGVPEVMEAVALRGGVIRRRGVDLEREQDPNVLKGLYVRDFVDREPEVVSADAPFDEVMDLIVQSEHAEFFVTSDSGELRGAIYLQQVRRLLHEQQDLRSLVVAADMTEPVVTVSEDDNLDLALQLLSRTVASEIAVVDGANPRKLVGSLHQREVLSAYNQEVLRRDLVAGVSNRLSIAGGGRRVDLGGPFVLTEHTAPRHFEGRTLKDLDIRRRAGLQVLLIRGASGAIRVPTADDRIAAGDRLVVAGPREAVDGIARL
jgi:CBS domain-containing protein